MDREQFKQQLEEQRQLFLQRYPFAKRAVWYPDMFQFGETQAQTRWEAWLACWEANRGAETALNHVITKFSGWHASQFKGVIDVGAYIQEFWNHEKLKG